MQESSPRIVLSSQLLLVTEVCELAAKSLEVPLHEMVDLFFQYTMYLERQSDCLNCWELNEDDGLPSKIEYDYDMVVNMLNEGWGSPSFTGFVKERHRVVAILKSDSESFIGWLKTQICVETSTKPIQHEQAYLNPDHPRYSPKLAAAVHAWEACGDAPRSSAKKALKAWLEAHASKYGLLLADGSMNKSGINDAATIANWNPLGGAPKTPG